MTPERVTPEQAQKLLDRVKEGCPLPWEIFTLETIEGDPREVKNVRCSEPGCDGHLAYSMDYDGTTEIDPDAIELVAAAPALAELVANLRYEYAVQGLDGGEWKFTGFDGKFLEPSESERIAWWNRPIPKRDIADRGAGWRIVRRLVGESEVVE